MEIYTSRIGGRLSILLSSVMIVYLDDLQAKLNALRELQSAGGEELSALMPSILDKAFKGEL